MSGPSLPDAELVAVPEHRVEPAQSRVAEAIVQLDAPGTVGPPEFALDPGALGAGGTAGWPWPGVSPGACPLSPVAPFVSPPVVPDETVAFDVDGA